MNGVIRTRAGRARRRGKRYVINSWRLALTCLLALLALELVTAALLSPCFCVKRVKVEGTKILSPALVAEHLNIAPQTNLFRLRSRAIVRHLESNPVVLSATAHKVPPGTLVVRIVERTPCLTLRTHGKYYEVDHAGVPFRVTPRPNAKLPMLVCRVPCGIALGKPLEAERFGIARECLVLAQRKKNFAVAGISVDQNGDLCLNTRDGLEIRLGRPARLEEKFEIVESTIEQLPSIRGGGEYIDVSCGREASALKLKDRP